MRSKRDEEFSSFVEPRRLALVRTATALTGGDRHLAEDLVQQCLVKLYLAWPRVRAARLDAYVRRALVNSMIDSRRGAFAQREQLWAEPPERSSNEFEGSNESEVLAALRQLPAGMRAAVVLRHVEGLSTEETAKALGCSAGTAKSQTSRGLERLRTILCADPDLISSPQPATEGTTL
jgi:RNA polymerase sigma-70 factor (sigma-E family)